jgi:polyhydroxyalkanoate synthesis regulator phasin
MMPKKKNPEGQKEQSERFKKTVADLVAAGELNPTEADRKFEKLVGKSKIIGRRD